MSIKSENKKFKKFVLIEFLKESTNLLEADFSEMPFEKVYIAWKRFLLEMMGFLLRNLPPVFHRKEVGKSVRINLYTVGSIYRCPRSKYGRHKTVPRIRMSGLWLENYGFGIGSRFEVYATSDELILKKLNAVDHLHPISVEMVEMVEGSDG